MRRPLLLAATALLGCAASGPLQRRPAHGAFPPAAREATWARAQEVVRAEGYEVGFADQARFIVVTKERELQAPCGEEQCLARESVFLRLGDGRAMLSIHRETWDQATRRWLAVSEPGGVERVEAAERAMLHAITGGGAELRLAREGEGCGHDAECERGLACSQRRCARR